MLFITEVEARALIKHHAQILLDQAMYADPQTITNIYTRIVAMELVLAKHQEHWWDMAAQDDGFASHKEKMQALEHLHTQDDLSDEVPF
jgi:hypothetical protein